MTLLAATPNGLYRVNDPGHVERVLDGNVWQVRVTDGVAYAATADGLVASADGGRSWRKAGVPASDVRSLAVLD